MEVLVLLSIIFIIVLLMSYKSYDSYGTCILSAELLAIGVVILFTIIGISGIVIRTL